MIERDNSVHAVQRHERSTHNAKMEAKRVMETLHQVRKNKVKEDRQKKLPGAARLATREKAHHEARPKMAPREQRPARADPHRKQARRDLQPIMESDVEFAFTLRRHPREEHLQCLVKEYLKTSRLLTVSHLQKFLSMKLQWQSHHTICLTDCTPVDEGVSPKAPLPSHLSLEAIYKERPSFRKHPILYYYSKNSRI